MHPSFAHYRKRYALAFVLDAAGLLSDRIESTCSVSRRLDISRSNVSRWRNGFFRNAEIAKWVCFYHGDLPRPLTLNELLSSVFDRCLTKAAQGMSRLKELFQSNLY